MGHPQEVEVDENKTVDIGNDKDRRRIISMEDPYKAFQVISQNADINYVSKLGKLLTNVADVMKD